MRKLYERSNLSVKILGGLSSEIMKTLGRNGLKNRCLGHRFMSDANLRESALV